MNGSLRRMPSPLLPMLGFGAAVLPVCLTPGVSFTLVTDRALTRGLPAASGVTIGTVAGLLTHALLASARLSAIVMSSAVAFTVVKLGGAMYLVCLGIWMVAKSIRHPPTTGCRRSGTAAVAAWR